MAEHNRTASPAKVFFGQGRFHHFFSPRPSFGSGRTLGSYGKLLLLLMGGGLFFFSWQVRARVPEKKATPEARGQSPIKAPAKRKVSAKRKAPLPKKPVRRKASLTVVSQRLVGRFPALKASNLNGKRLQLPRDFAGRLNLVLVSFSRKHHKITKTWKPLVKKLLKQHKKLRYFAFPVISRGYRFLRGIINRGMRSGIKDPQQRASTVTLYINKTPFRRSLRIPHERTIFLFLVDNKGHVYWRQRGPHTPATASDLRRSLRRLFAATP